MQNVEFPINVKMYPCAHSQVKLCRLPEVKEGFLTIQSCEQDANAHGAQSRSSLNMKISQSVSI